VTSPDNVSHLSYFQQILRSTPMSFLITGTLVALLAGVLVVIYKGSRPLQPIPENSTPPRHAVFAALMPVLCTAALYATFIYLRDHLFPPRPLAILFAGVIAPWCVGLYFAYRAARTANRVLRAIGAVEVLIFLLAGALVLIARG
jgi:hypothetical protein